MSELERVDDTEALAYPMRDFAYVARSIGILDSPDIESYYQSCLESDFANEIDYKQGLLTIVHAFDIEHMDGIADRELHGLGLLLADVHYKTAHYSECLYELQAIECRLMSEGAKDTELIKYVAEAIYGSGLRVKDPTDPVVSSKILANKNLPA
jgi:hypothetical protein